MLNACFFKTTFIQEPDGAQYYNGHESGEEEVKGVKEVKGEEGMKQHRGLRIPSQAALCAERW